MTKKQTKDSVQPKETELGEKIMRRQRLEIIKRDARENQWWEEHCKHCQWSERGRPCVWPGGICGSDVKRDR